MLDWILIIGGIIAFIIAYKILKSIIKTLLLFSFITFIVVGIFSFFIFSEMHDFKDKFPEAEKLFVLEKNGTIISGTKVDKLEFSTQEMPKGIEKEELAKINTIYKKEGIEGIKEDYFIVLMMKYSLFEKGLADEVFFGNTTFSKDEVLQAYEDEEPSRILIRNLLNQRKNSNSSNYALISKDQIFPNASEEDIRSLFVILGFSDIMNKKGASYMIKAMKKDNLIIYPNYLVFNLVEHVPDFIIDRFVKSE